jgi:hypothetical protein
LLKAIEGNGWVVQCPAKSINRGTGVKLLGGEVAISLEEKHAKTHHLGSTDRLARTIGRYYALFLAVRLSFAGSCGYRAGSVVRASRTL